MRKTRVWMLVGLLLCTGAAGAAPGARSAQTPEDVDRLFGERVNAGDAEGVVALYEPNATLVRQDGTSASGTEAIRAEIGALIALHPHITMHVTKVLRGGGDAALLYDDWIATGVDEKAQPVTLSGRATELVRRQSDGSWRFVIDDPDARGTR